MIYDRRVATFFIFRFDSCKSVRYASRANFPHLGTSHTVRYMEVIYCAWKYLPLNVHVEGIAGVEFVVDNVSWGLAISEVHRFPLVIYSTIAAY